MGNRIGYSFGVFLRLAFWLTVFNVGLIGVLVATAGVAGLVRADRGLSVLFGVLMLIVQISSLFELVAAISQALARQGGRLAHINYDDDAQIPNELGQAIQNADTSFIRDALHSHDPGRMETALEQALALLDTLKHLAKVLFFIR